ncbi:MAG: Zn-dependent protease with chaperone function [Planctomycetaceae bacterium]|nr:Zn-dependent protease with chaperone function [Planctomycetaceae bacterium]
MVMDFIEDQEKARSRTGRLVILFLLAVVGTVLAVYLVAAGVMVAMTQSEETPASWWMPELLGVVGGGTLLVIVVGSLVKTAQLASGGKAVAESLGGTLVHPEDRDPDIRRLMNVVEEMSIASGCPMPPVYLIDDASINAFAAGFGFDSAVIGVTRGCVQQLTRDELQGVMAHEFSHIVHGDMKLNIRLTGLIFGIMALGFLGYICFRFIGPVLARSGGGKNNPGPALGLAIIVGGLALMAIGSLGTLAARLIQAAVSRQREYLADAAAVDYTRNPSGIAGALRRIGGFRENDLRQSAASEFQHFFFTSALSTAFATHPPLADRIARIENRPTSEIEEAMADRSGASEPPPPNAAGFAGSVASMADRTSEVSESREVRAAEQVRESIARLGEPDADHLAYARTLLGSIPDPVRASVNDTIGAKAVCLLLLVDEDAEVRSAQASALSENLDALTIEEVRRLRKTVATAVGRNPELRLALLDLSMPALGRMPEEDRPRFMDSIRAMQEADGRLDRFEWLLGRILRKHLMGGSSKPAGASVRPNRSIALLEDSVRLVLAMLAWSGARNETEALHAFREGARRVRIGDVELPDRTDCSVMALDRALDRLRRLRWRDRAVLLDAAVETVCADGHGTLAEIELLRALAAAIECPMPPVLPGRLSS